MKAKIIFHQMFYLPRAQFLHLQICIQLTAIIKPPKRFVYFYLMKPIPIFNHLLSSPTSSTTTCPLLYEFYQTALDSYTDRTITKIKQHLEPQQHIFLVTPSSVPKYEDIYDEQLKRRGFSLNILFDYLLVVKQLSTQPNQAIFKDRGLKQETYMGWLKQMILTVRQISQVNNRRKQIVQKKQYDSKTFVNQLLPHIFDTELYIMQIMLRICLYKVILEENHNYFMKLMALNNQYEAYVFDQGGWDSEVIRQEQHKQMNKSTKFLLKNIVKQIDKITQLYWFQLSCNRSNAKMKPQLEAMLDILNDRLQQGQLSFILKNSKQLNRIFNERIQFTKAVIFQPYIIRNINPEEENKHNEAYHQEKRLKSKSKLQKLELVHLSPKNEFKSTNSFSQLEQIHEKMLMTPQKSKSQPTKSVNGNSEQQNPISYRTAEPKAQQNFINHKILKTYKPERTHQTNPTPKEKQQTKSKHSNKNLSKLGQKMSNLNHYDKLKYISSNQRFGQSSANILGRLIKPKKTKQILDVEKEDNKRKQYFYEARQHHIDLQAFDETPDNYMVLAEETPSERKYAWLDE